MAEGSFALARKRGAEESRRDELCVFPAFSLITFHPIVNFLESFSQQQRLAFFEELRRLSDCRKGEELANSRSILNQTIRLSGNRRAQGRLGEAVRKGEPGSDLAAIVPVSMKAEGKEKSEYAIQPPSHGMPLPELKKAASPQQKELGALAAARAESAGPSLLPLHAKDAAQKLSFEVKSYAGEDSEKAFSIVSEFESRIEKASFKADDLMGVLLLVIEDDIAAGSGAGGPSSGPSHLGIQAIPRKLRTSALDSAEARLASVREMLRYYFMRNPDEYVSVLASALGLTTDQEWDDEYFQERLAYELASVGSFALAERMAAQLKRRKRMDTKKCLLELGYLYDPKKKRIILGKRTCGKPVEARGIIAALLSGMTRKAKS